MRQYLELMRHVAERGHRKNDRTGTGTLSVFGWQMRFDLAEGFPLLTTKKLHTRSIIHELLWFLRGDTNIKYLKDNGVSIWDEWADENGELGPVLRNATQRVSGVDSRGRVEGKSPAPPQAKRLDPAHGLNGLSTSELARKEAIAQKSLAFARDNDLSPSLIEWHSVRLRLIQEIGRAHV